MEYRPGYCRVCEGNRKLERPRVNHVLHLILSIVTFGIWILVWLLVGVFKQNWRCADCGSKKVKKKALA